MPRNTVGGGFSSRWDQPELPLEYEPAPDTDAMPEQPEPPSEPEEPDEGTVTGDYSTYTVRDLVRECQARGIPYSGPNGSLPKAELVAKLAEQG